jgi:hypothetical protein
MAASAGDVTRLRRMVAEPTTTTYSDSLLEDAIERYPVPDAAGLFPEHDDWTATYDLHAAASEVWSEKAAALAGNFDFTADGATFRREQVHANALKQARYHAARRAWGTVTMARDDIEPVEDDSN